MKTQTFGYSWSYRIKQGAQASNALGVGFLLAGAVGHSLLIASIGLGFVFIAGLGLLALTR